MNGLSIIFKRTNRLDKKGHVKIRYTDPMAYSKSFPTGVTVEEKYWNRDLQRVDASCPFHEILNAKLEKKLRIVCSATANLYKGGVERPSKKMVVDEVKRLEDQNRDVLELFQEWLDFKESRGKTTRVYEAVMKSVIRYTEEFGGLMSPNALSQDMVESWVEGLKQGYLGSKGRPLSDSTIKGYVEKLAEFIKYCKKRGLMREGYTLDISSVTHSLKPMRFPKPVLTDDEVRALLAVEAEDVFPISEADRTTAKVNHIRAGGEIYGRWWNANKERLYQEAYEARLRHTRAARDAVVFMMWTGKRAGEVMALKMEDISFNGNMHFGKIVMKKTTRENIFAIPGKAMDMVRKQNVETGVIFNVPSGNKVKYVYWVLQKMAKQAGLNRLITKRRVYNGKLIEEAVPLWKIVGTHSGRRTFATNLIKKNGRTPEVMAILQNSLGHKSMAQTEAYIDRTQEDFENDASKLIY